MFPLSVSHCIHFSTISREKHFHVKSFVVMCWLWSRNLMYRSMAFLYASTVWGLHLSAACSRHVPMKLNISAAVSFLLCLVMLFPMSLYVCL